MSKPKSLPLQPGAQLQQVQIVFRHGARTPLTTKHEQLGAKGVQWDVCGDAYTPVPVIVTTADGKPQPENSHNTRQLSSRLAGGSHMGQLTEYGQLQARDFGRWLRSRYVEELRFLPPTFQEGVLHARSTNFQRTVLTLRGVLTGLLEEGASTPVPVVTSTDIDEILYGDPHACPNLQAYIAAGKKLGKELAQGDDEFASTCEKLTPLLKSWGHDVQDASYFESPYLWTDLHDVMTSMAAAKKPLPPGVDAHIVAVVQRLATLEFAPMVAPIISDSHGHTTLRMSMGVLLRTVLDNMQASLAARDGSSAQPPLPLMYLYSGHDSTIMPLLSALGLSRLLTWPPYLSNIEFELWRQPDGEAVVRVLRDREPLDLPHCPPGHCPTLDAFVDEILGPLCITREDLHHMCHQVPMQHVTSLPQPSN